MAPATVEITSTIFIVLLTGAFMNVLDIEEVKPKAKSFTFLEHLVLPVIATLIASFLFDYWTNKPKPAEDPVVRNAVVPNEDVEPLKKFGRDLEKDIEDEKAKGKSQVRQIEMAAK